MSTGSGEQILFKHPPVVEKAMGVEFAPLPGWAAPHFGLLWAAIRADYPKFELQPPLPSQIEQTGQQKPQPPGVTIEFGDPFRIRAWFIDSSKARLLQVQDNRLVVNWRKLSPQDSYPHYTVFKPVFLAEWARFREVLSKNGFASPRVLQCELTYVNHFPRGQGWNDYSDLPKVLTPWAGTGRALPSPESVAWNARFPLPDGRGRLHIAAQPAIRHVDGCEVLQVTLTARGAPSNDTAEEMVSWFDFGRQWLVDSFTSITTTEMQRFWNEGSGDA